MCKCAGAMPHEEGPPNRLDKDEEMVLASLWLWDAREQWVLTCTQATMALFVTENLSISGPLQRVHGSYHHIIHAKPLENLTKENVIAFTENEEISTREETN